MLEHVLRFSIRHRVLVVLVSLLAAAVGVRAFQLLPLDAVPDITNRQVQINAFASGLSPEEVEKLVTSRIERALAGIPGLDRTRSLSRSGFCQVTAVFDDDVDVYFARQQIGERLAEAREILPTGVEPAMGAISTGLGEVYMWSVRFAHPGGKGAIAVAGRPGWQPDGAYLTTEGRLLRTETELGAHLRAVQDWIVRPRIQSVDGVAAVEAIGGYVKTYVVQPDPGQLVAYGVGFHDLLDALERNNVTLGAGTVEQGEEGYVVRADGRVRTTSEIEEIVVGARDGTPIHLRDVAVVEVGKELRSGSASQGGEEVVVATAMMLVGENSRTVAAAVDARVRAIRASNVLPPDVVLDTVLDRTGLVVATVRTVVTNLAEGAILVVVVLFLMLGSVRAAVLTALAIPLSMLLTATGMVRAGISGNLMSLGAIDFGLIVDGAVIIVENCLRHLAGRQAELGRTLTLEERLEVVFQASRQVRIATAFGEAIIIIVYLPILALTGVEGKMFHPMALTVILALVSAFLLSLTFVPAAVALFLTGRVRERENPLVRWARALYAPVLTMALEHRRQVVALGCAIVLFSIAVYGRLGQEFVPSLDEHDLAIHAMRIPSVSLTHATGMQKQVERTLEAVPEVARVFSKTGTAEMASDPMPPNVSDTFVILKPRGQWPDPGKGKLSLIGEIEDRLRELPGQEYEFTQPIQMRFNELIAGVRGDVAVEIFGYDMEDLRRSALSVARVLSTLPGAADVKVEQTAGLPSLDVEIDREAVARHGLNVADVQEVLSIAVGGREAGTVFEGDRTFSIVVRLPERMRRDTGVLSSLPIPLSHGDREATPLVAGDELGADRTHWPFLRLGDVAEIVPTEGLNQIGREQGKRRIVVQANVRGRDLGGFVAEAEPLIEERVELAPGQWIEWGGQFENLLEARRRLAVVVPICLLLIFLLLFATFESVRHALLVFTGVPLALTGGVVALWLRGIPFSISAAVGFIALSGVAVLNGLVMVTFYNQLLREGRPLAEAVREGSLIRLRPVLMTALVASLGFVPMAVATGTGAEVQRPLATVVIGGLISSTLLTLVVLPALYRMVERRPQGAAESGSPPPEQGR